MSLRSRGASSAKESRRALRGPSISTIASAAARRSSNGSGSRVRPPRASGLGAGRAEPPGRAWPPGTLTAISCALVFETPHCSATFEPLRRRGRLRLPSPGATASSVVVDPAAGGASDSGASAGGPSSVGAGASATTCSGAGCSATTASAVSALSTICSTGSAEPMISSTDGWSATTSSTGATSTSGSAGVSGTGGCSEAGTGGCSASGVSAGGWGFGSSIASPFQHAGLARAH